jgi:hypothetical protein
MAKTADFVVVHHTDALHVGVYDGVAYKFEAAFF